MPCTYISHSTEYNNSKSAQGSIFRISLASSNTKHIAHD